MQQFLDIDFLRDNITVCLSAGMMLALVLLFVRNARPTSSVVRRHYGPGAVQRGGFSIARDAKFLPPSR